MDPDLLIRLISKYAEESQEQKKYMHLIEISIPGPGITGKDADLNVRFSFN